MFGYRFKFLWSNLNGFPLKIPSWSTSSLSWYNSQYSLGRFEAPDSDCMIVFMFKKNVKLLHFLTMPKSHRMGLLKHDGCGACSLCLVDNCDMCNMSDYAPMKWTQRAFIFLTTVYLMPGGGGKNTRPRWWGCGHILSNTRQRVPKLFVLATVHFLGE